MLEEEHKLVEGRSIIINQSDDKRLIWTSCCLKMDRSATVYIGQMIFSLFIVSFSVTQLYLADGSCEKSSPYLSLISFILGKLLASVITTH